MARSAFRDADAVDAAEHLEELPFDFRQEAHQSRGDAAVRRIAFQVMDRVQTHFALQAVLQLPAHELGDQHLVVEGTGDHGCRVIVHMGQAALDARNHESIAFC